MNSRLQQFLELESLTPARLADTLGVQRSGLSHILSGRNKPGYDFIYKLLIKFPSINAEWILTGKGKPYKEMSSFSPSSGSQSGVHPFPNQDTQYSNQQYNNISYNNQSLKDQPILDKLDKSDHLSGFENDFEAHSLFSTEKSKTENAQNSNLSTNNQTIIPKEIPSKVRENPINGTIEGIVRKEKSIKRVIVFYSDGSFEELFPQK